MQWDLPLNSIILEEMLTHRQGKVSEPAGMPT